MKARLLLFASGALALAFLLPNHYPPWASFHAEAMAALALVPISIWAAFQRRPLGPLAVGMLLLSLVPLGQLVAGQIRFAGDAWMAWLYLTGFGLAVHAGACAVRDRGAWRSQLEVLISVQVSVLMAALVSTAIATHQWLDLGLMSALIVELPKDSRPFANLAQPNQLVSLLMLGLAAVAFLFEAGAIRARIALMTIAFIVCGFVMTQSRTVLLGIVFIWVAFVALHRRAELRTTTAALVGVTAFYAILTAAWPLINELLLLQHRTSLAERMVENLRITLWRSMLDALGMSPWVGWGWGQISFAQQATALNYPATRWWFESSHNLFLDLALWAGVPIALAVAVGLLAWFVRRVAACRDPLSWCLLIGIGCVFCHAMVEFPLSYAYFLLPVGLLMGAVGVPREAQSHGRQARRVGVPERVIVAALGLTVIATYAKVITEYLTLEEEWRNFRLSRTFVGAEPPLPAKDIYVLTQLQSRVAFARIDPTSRLSEPTLEWMQHVALRYGATTFMFPYARALAVNARMPEAERVLAVMCKTQMPSACDRALKEWSTFDFPQATNAPSHATQGGVAP